VKAEPKKDVEKMSNFSMSMGKFGAAKMGIYLDTGENQPVAQAKRDEVSCPEGVPTLIHVDFQLKEGFDDQAVGELAGSLDAIINAIPFAQIPINLYHSHTVDVVNAEKGKALRITLFSPMDLQDLMAGIAGQQQGGASLKDAGRGHAKFEFPFDLSDLKDPAFRFTTANMKFRIHSEGELDRRLLAQNEADIAQMSPGRAWVQSMRNAFATALRGFELSLHFADLGEFTSAIPDFAVAAPQHDQPQRGGPARLRVHRGHRGAGGEEGLLAHHAPQAPPSDGQSFKMALAQAAQAPISQFIEMGLAQVPMMAAAMGQQALYDGVRNNIVGLARIHVQAHDFVFRVNFKGLDFAQLLPVGGGGMPGMPPGAGQGGF